MPVPRRQFQVFGTNERSLRSVFVLKHEKRPFRGIRRRSSEPKSSGFRLEVDHENARLEFQTMERIAAGLLPLPSGGGARRGADRVRSAQRQSDRAILPQPGFPKQSRGGNNR